MKNIFKKACVLGAAGLVTLGMSSSVANAAAPTASDIGALYGTQVTIGKGVAPFSLALTFNSDLMYTGSSKQLITAVTSGIPDGTELYLRVADTQGAAPTESSPWVRYVDEDSLNTNSLCRTNRGTYYIYYYLDGGENYNDISTTP